MPTMNSLVLNQSLSLKAARAPVVGLLILLSCIFAINFGSAEISLQEVIKALYASMGGETDISLVKQRIVWELRVPRVLLALLCGAGLSVAGAVLQNVTRNPLADPYLFGISSGASFGAVIVLAAMGAGNAMLAQYGVTVGAFVGSVLSVLLVISLAGTGVQVERMILAGVAVSFMFSAGTSLVLYSSDPQVVASLLFWTLGSFTAATWESLLLPSIVILIVMMIFIGYSRPLKAILAGDENAQALGLDVSRMRIGMLVLCSLLTATLVANCGGIGFVGLMIPHIVRRLMWREGGNVLIVSAILGGVFMVWVDVLARTLITSNELPIGVITAAIGSLFFLLVLRKRGWTE